MNTELRRCLKNAEEAAVTRNISYEVPLKAHLSDARIVSMPDDATVKLMSEGFSKIDIATDIKGDYEDAYLELYVINEGGVEAPVKSTTLLNL